MIVVVLKQASRRPARSVPFDGRAELHMPAVDRHAPVQRKRWPARDAAKKCSTWSPYSVHEPGQNARWRAVQPGPPLLGYYYCLQSPLLSQKQMLCCVAIQTHSVYGVEWHCRMPIPSACQRVQFSARRGRQRIGGVLRRGTVVGR